MPNDLRTLFDLPPDVTYLNAAYMSPQMRIVTEVGKQAVARKSRPHTITVDDFFRDKKLLKKYFAELIAAPDPSNIALIPSVSYGMAIVARNAEINPGDEILLVAEQFPSNVYSWHRAAKASGAKIREVPLPEPREGRGERWNRELLESINKHTAVIAMPHVHWADGTLYDLRAIREKADEVNALLVIDATQSVGALPLSVKEIEPDAVICAGYKWLMGPYGLGLAYFNDQLCEGIPIEENWINRKQSEQFSNLTKYRDAYQPKAGRFDVGESSDFIHVPMLLTAIKQVLEWDPAKIQDHCSSITSIYIPKIRELGYFVEDEEYRSSHLFGLYLPEGRSIAGIKERLDAEKVFVSVRGSAIRVSPHLYNTEDDLRKLLSCL